MPYPYTDQRERSLFLKQKKTYNNNREFTGHILECQIKLVMTKYFSWWPARGFLDNPNKFSRLFDLSWIYPLHINLIYENCLRTSFQNTNLKYRRILFTSGFDLNLHYLLCRYCKYKRTSNHLQRKQYWK